MAPIPSPKRLVTVFVISFANSHSFQYDTLVVFGEQQTCAGVQIWKVMNEETPPIATYPKWSNGRYDIPHGNQTHMRNNNLIINPTLICLKMFVSS